MPIIKKKVMKEKKVGKNELRRAWVITPDSGSRDRFSLYRVEAILVCRKFDIFPYDLKNWYHTTGA